MQHTSRHGTVRSHGRSRHAGRTGRASTTDAIALLRADHRQVEQWFGLFEKSRSADRKAELASRICQALRMHTTVEEELFYPAYLEATADDDLHHEARIEHDLARHLIAQIESGGAGDEYFEARINVLAEMIRHHIREEEMRDGMFAKARRSEMDLEQLGEQMRERWQELETVSGKRLS
jgi:hemerythrin superfamily protein